MKRLFAGIALAVYAALSQAATLVPIQLLNPVGSTSNQALVSAGASSAPAWAAIVNSVAGRTGAVTLAVADVSGAAPLASPTFTGTVTAAAITATGAITPSQTVGIVGTTTNNNANAGAVGEYPSPTNLTSVAMTSGTASNVSSASLTAGDWDIQCDIGYAPAGTTTMTGMIASVSTTTNTHSFTLGDLAAIQGISTAAGSSQFISTPVVRKSFASTTTVYCVASAGFNVSTLAASGFMRARRVR